MIINKKSSFNNYFPKIFFSLSVLFLLFIGSYLRLYKIFDYPPSIFIDEYNLGLNALDIYTNKSFVPFFGIGWYGTPAAYLYYILVIFKLVGPGIIALKIAWIIPSILTLLFVFILSKVIFNKTVAFYSLIFIVFSPLHIHLSLWAHGAITIPLFLLISIYFYWLFKEKNKVLFMLFSAVSLSFAILTYVGGRVFILFFLLVTFTDLLILVIQKKFKYRKLLIYLLFWVTLLVVLSPFIFYGIKHPGDFWGRSKDIFIFSTKDSLKENLFVLFDNIKKYFLMLIYYPDPNPRHTPFPLTSVFNPFIVFLFFSGLFFLILKKKIKELILFILWIFTIVAGGVVTEKNAAPSIFRTASIIPLYYMIASYSLFEFKNIINKIFNFKKELIINIIFAFFVIAFSIANSYKYFLLLNDRKNINFLLTPFTKTENMVAEIAYSNYPTKKIYLTDDFYWFSSTQFIVRARSGRNNYPYWIFPRDDLNKIQFDELKPILLIMEPKYQYLIEKMGKFFVINKINYIKNSDGLLIIITVEINKLI